MRPDDTTSNPTPLNRGDIAPPARDASRQQAAVAQMTRDQINRIYQEQAASQQSNPADTPPEAVQSTPYHQTHQPHTSIDKKQWEHYHSSWQNYYQRYYEQYYHSAVQNVGKTYQAHADKLQQQFAEQPSPAQTEEKELTQDEALSNLRSELLSKVQTSAKKVRKSRHFIPAITALCVLLVFAFMQYNSVIFSYAQAYVSPGNIDPQNIITDPNASVKVGKAPRIIVPRFNIDVPVVYENTMGRTAKETHNKQMDAMRKGVAYFGAKGFSARPGELGNFGISGHSSNDITDSGAAKFVFAPLLRMKKGDIFYLHYEGTRYTYNIVDIKEVKPNQVGELAVGNNKAMATLITCTPLGTAEKRLLLFGEQISPNPDKAKKSTSSGGDASAADPGEMAGRAPTVFERLFGAQ